MTRLACKLLALSLGVMLSGETAARAGMVAQAGLASWYGEEHRGRLMANGRKFDPDKFTAASWFYPLGAKVRVTARTADNATRSVLVTITDRGPNADFVKAGRIIDLSHAPFKKLAPPERGLVAVTVRPVRK